MPPTNEPLSDWQVSVRTETPVGLWTFSCCVYAQGRAEAEQIATKYIHDMFRGQPQSIARVRKGKNVGHALRAKGVLYVKGADGYSVS